MTVLEISAGDTAWVLVSAAMVLLMTPGLAFFYGGMVRAKSVLNMLMMSITTMGIVGVLWVVVGYSMAFGDSIGGFLGNPLEFLFMAGVMDPELATFTVPAAVFAGFQAVHLQLSPIGQIRVQPFGPGLRKAVVGLGPGFVRAAQADTLVLQGVQGRTDGAVQV